MLEGLGIQLKSLLKKRREMPLQSLFVLQRGHMKMVSMELYLNFGLERKVVATSVESALIGKMILK